MKIKNFIKKKIILPLTFITAAAILPNIVLSQEKSTLMEITENGYGNLVINKEGSGQGIPDATVIWTPIDIPGDSIPDPYEYTTNNSGFTGYDVLVFHDTGVGINENIRNMEIAQARPNPSTDFTFNYLTNNKPTNDVKILDMTGRTVKEIKLENYINNVAIYYANLDNLANGTYIATTTMNGKIYSDKIIKINGRQVGNLGSSAKEKTNDFKATTSHEAIYEIKISKEEYYDLVAERTVIEGDNGWDGYELTPLPGLPKNQDFAGIIKNGDDNFSAIQGASIILENLTTGEEFTRTSDLNGSFIFENMPVKIGDLGTQQNYRISAGGKEEFYAFTNIPYTPKTYHEDDWTAQDTINNNFNLVFKYKLTNTSAQHIKDQTASGTRQDTVKYNLGNSFSSTDKNILRGYFTQFEIEENNSRVFAESLTPLSGTGINIEYGAYNTQTDDEEVITPLGHTLYPVLYATSTMHPGDFKIFVHEIKRAIGIQGVGWYSVMRADTPDYTEEDRSIGEFEADYWTNVYQNGETCISLDYITESIEAPPFPANQDLAGHVCHGNSYLPVQGLSIKVENLNTGALYTTTTNSGGDYIIHNLPLYTGYLVSAGGIDSLYAFKDIPYHTPTSVSAEDTIQYGFDLLLLPKLSTSSAAHIKDQSMNSTRQDTVSYYLRYNYSEAEKDSIRAWFAQFQQAEGHIFSFIETNEAPSGGIYLSPGSGSPWFDTEEVDVGFGTVFHPVIFAFTYFEPDKGYLKFVHLIKQSLGLSEVNWPNANSVMEADAPEYTQEDRDIARFERHYWNAIYRDGKTHVSLEYISEGLN